MKNIFITMLALMGSGAWAQFQQGYNRELACVLFYVDEFSVPMARVEKAAPLVGDPLYRYAEVDARHGLVDTAVKAWGYFSPAHGLLRLSLQDQTSDRPNNVSSDAYVGADQTLTLNLTMDQPQELHGRLYQVARLTCQFFSFKDQP